MYCSECYIDLISVNEVIRIQSEHLVQAEHVNSQTNVMYCRFSAAITHTYLAQGTP